MDTHLAHVMLGTRAYDIHSPRRTALYLLNNILGGPGMNARLNLSLRERNGLVYGGEFDGELQRHGVVGNLLDATRRTCNGVCIWCDANSTA